MTLETATCREGEAKSLRRWGRFQLWLWLYLYKRTDKGVTALSQHHTKWWCDLRCSSIPWRLAASPGGAWTFVYTNGACGLRTADRNAGLVGTLLVYNSVITSRVLFLAFWMVFQLTELYTELHIKVEALYSFMQLSLIETTQMILCTPEPMKWLPPQHKARYVKSKHCLTPWKWND